MDRYLRKLNVMLGIFRTKDVPKSVIISIVIIIQNNNRTQNTLIMHRIRVCIHLQQIIPLTTCITQTRIRTKKKTQCVCISKHIYKNFRIIIQIL